MQVTCGHGVLQELREPALKLRGLIPEVYSGFASLGKAATAEGELSTKHKELIALSCAVVKHCDGCIASHARGAARAGATEQEVAEALGVTILMEGGPATVYGPRALAAFLEAKEKLAG
ncbi:MAG: alkylhydroperoxidase [Arachnia propionica]|nr:MAG: alkylhydroperoxidase [Arachnia propionica]